MKLYLGVWIAYNFSLFVLTRVLTTPFGLRGATMAYLACSAALALFSVVLYGGLLADKRRAALTACVLAVSGLAVGSQAALFLNGAPFPVRAALLGVWAGLVATSLYHPKIRKVVLS